MKRKVFSAKIFKQIFVIATFSMHSINFSSSSFYAAIHWKISKIHIYKGIEKKSARKWSVDGEVENKIFIWNGTQHEKSVALEIIFWFFLSNSAFFWEHQHQIWEKKSKALKKYRKAANCHTFIDFCLSRALWHSQLILYLRSTHIPFTFFFSFFAFPSIPSIIYTHFYSTIPSFVVFTK